MRKDMVKECKCDRGGRGGRSEQAKRSVFGQGEMKALPPWQHLGDCSQQRLEA